jgi:hypothetical protein
MLDVGCSMFNVHFIKTLPTITPIVVGRDDDGSDVF